MSDKLQIAAWLWTCAGALYTSASVLGLLWVYFPNFILSGFSRFAGVMGFALHTAALASRWQEQGEVPLSNFVQASYFLAWTVVAAFLTIEAFGHLRGIGIFLSPLLTVSYWLTAGFRDAIVVSDGQRASWFWIHVCLSVFAYAFFIISFLIGTMFLIQNRALKKKQLGRFFRALPSIDLLEKWNAISATISLVLLSLALTVGAYAAKGGLGHWVSDPMVVASFALWLILAWMARLRFWKKVRGRSVADWSVVGFAVVVLSLCGAHWLGHGQAKQAQAEETPRDH